MNNIYRFKDFNEKRLYVFDFDDTLVKTHSFEDLASVYIKESKTVKELLIKSLDKVNMRISDLRYENGRIYIEDPNSKIEFKDNWVRRGKRLYLTTPDLFSYIEESLPNETKKEMVEIYNSVEDKCIVTARPEGSRKNIESTLKNLNLNMPKFGLHMKPDKLKNSGEWKGFKICEIAEKYKFNSVIFYDDNIRYIKKAKKVVNSRLPNLDFRAIKVS
jgi:hypothetical protein